jgi:agmatine deiminase
MRLPAEWDIHAATWLAWPDLVEEWKENHEGARAEFIALCKTIALEGNNPREKLKIFIRNEEEKKRVIKELAGIAVEFHQFDYGDIWIRDTGCIFSKSFNGKKSASVFYFNGWGGKWLLRKDAELSKYMAEMSGAEIDEHEYVLEGGAVDHNGQGICITTEECLLNPNRNPKMTKVTYENRFRELGNKDICWIKEGLLNDHTDGHVDNIVRFVSRDTFLCMLPGGADDPHAERLTQIHDQLQVWAKEFNLKVVTLKAPGRVDGPDGEFMPASYMNFYIANNSVAVPIYGTPNDTQAVEKLQELFPTRKVVGLMSKNLLTGGGSFHCITQQEHR